MMFSSGGESEPEVRRGTSNRLKSCVQSCVESDWFQHLKLKRHTLPKEILFKINLRHYTEAPGAHPRVGRISSGSPNGGVSPKGGMAISSENESEPEGEGGDYVAGSIPGGLASKRRGKMLLLCEYVEGELIREEVVEAEVRNLPAGAAEDSTGRMSY